jgi:hypothetical protein
MKTNADGSTDTPVRLSEVVATLSMLSALGMGRPLERLLRQTVVAMRLAEAAGSSPEVTSAAYYTSLLTWVTMISGLPGTRTAEINRAGEFNANPSLAD